MKIPQTQVIPYEQVLQIVNQVEEKGWKITFLPEKQQLIIENEVSWLAKLFLPWTMTWLPEGKFQILDDVHYCLTLFRAGQAAVGYFHQ